MSDPETSDRDVRKQRNAELAALVVAVQEACDLSTEAARSIDERDAALDRLKNLVKCERFAAISKGHERIGELTTGKHKRVS